MKKSNYIVVFVTSKDKAEAQRIAQYLLKQKCAACVNIVDGIQSLFWWEGKIDQSAEVLLIIKSKKSLFRKIVSGVRAVHSYSVPEIIALPIAEGHQDYLKWIDTVLR